MPAWSELQDQLNSVEPKDRGSFLAETSFEYISQIAERCQLNVLYYASGFLQKPQVPGLFTSITTASVLSLTSWP